MLQDIKRIILTADLNRNIQQSNILKETKNRLYNILFKSKGEFKDIMEMVKDFVGGTASGILQVFVQQPFQIVKTRLANQSIKNPHYGGIVDCCRKIISADGVFGFYKGTLSPLIGVGPQVAAQFATNEAVKRALNKLTEGKKEDGLLSLKQALVSGFVTGIPSALLLTPIDLVKIQMQVKDNNKNYHGSIDAARSIFREKGIRGIYLGFIPTLLREMTALSIYFGTYEFGKNRFIYNSGQENLPLIASFFLGGFAGAASWLPTYPIDYVKTIIQSQRVNKILYRSMFHCARVKFEEKGIKTFFKGLGVTMLRSFPVNGVGFVSFQIAMNSMGRTQNIRNAE